MKAILAISTLTLREAIRNKILYMLFVFAIVLISLSWVISQLTIGDELKIIKDLGLNSIHFFGVLITVFTGIGLVFREMEKRTIYLILSKPVHRFEFLMGKFLGLAATLFVVLIGLTLVFSLVLIIRKSFSLKILPALGLIYLEWLMIAGVAMLFSSFSTPLLSGMMTIACFLTGHLSSGLLLLQKRLTSDMAYVVTSTLYYFLPNLELFNIRAQTVHNLSLSTGYFLEVILYWFLYLGVLLLLSIGIFQRKDFV